MPSARLNPARMAMMAPRYAEKLNSGPGMACTMPSPARNCSRVTHESGVSVHTCEPVLSAGGIVVAMVCDERQDEERRVRMAS